MANAVYNSYKLNTLIGNINLTADDIRLALVTSSYSPDIDNDTVYASIVSGDYEVVTGGGYVTSGVILSGTTVTQVNEEDAALFDAEDVLWASSTITARGGVIFKDSGSSATSPLICYIDFGSTQSSVNSNFTISWATSGIMYLS
jgi:hypothetical protein